MDRNESIRKHTSDMAAVEQHILDAIVRQRDDDRTKNNVEVNQLVIKIERALKKHVSELENLAKQYDANIQSATKEALTKLLGIAAGLYDKVRGKHPLSRDLRDNYTALSLAAMGYTAYHTFGLAIGEDRITSLAERHLKDLTPLMVEISHLLPHVVAKEVGEESDFSVDTSVGAQAVENTQAAWTPEAAQRTSPSTAGTDSGGGA